ncbi:recombinase family protein [Sphingobium yanoikuyae]|uniref:recombinase family protein n=1 Tax=Sphingobium yanoikuyae TaxID=13690 RepID=UPI00289AE2EE|nr:recombinase family protein [Sphingobium yanoikuyae]
MTAQFIGYARVSSTGQSLDIQEAMLTEAGCRPIFAEKKSGRRASDREELARAIAHAREGDTLIVTRLDRLARSVIDLHQIIATLTEKGVAFRALQQSGIDTSTSAGKLLLTMLGAVAEFEADIRAERQKDGIEAAKAKGVYKGRPASIDAAAIQSALAAGETPAAVAKRLNIARSTVYRLKDAAPV